MTAINAGDKMSPMTNNHVEPRSNRLARRLEELGISKAALHTASKKSRNTIDKALAGDPKVRPATYDDLFRVLDDLEADRQDGVQHYTPDGAPDLVTIQMTGVFGIESVTFSGPTDDADAIKQAAVDFVRQVREGDQGK